MTDKDGEWWKGSLNEQFGSFPSNYVKHHVPETTPLRSSTVPAIPPSPSPSPSSSSLASDTSVTSHVKPLVARVTKQYMATKETELSLKAGQYVKVRVYFVLFAKMFIYMFVVYNMYKRFCFV